MHSKIYGFTYATKDAAVSWQIIEISVPARLIAYLLNDESVVSFIPKESDSSERQIWWNERVWYN